MMSFTASCEALPAGETARCRTAWTQCSPSHKGTKEGDGAQRRWDQPQERQDGHRGRTRECDFGLSFKA